MRTLWTKAQFLIVPNSCTFLVEQFYFYRLFKYLIHKKVALKISNLFWLQVRPRIFHAFVLLDVINV